MLALIALIGAASAASNQVALEGGWIGSPDRNWDLFSPATTYGTFGLRGGLKVHDRVTAIVGWHHGKTGMIVTADRYLDDYYEEDEEYYASESYSGYHTSFTGDQVALGAKADVRIAKWLQPYAALQLVGMRGVARFDDDVSDDENPTQVQRAGVTGGLMATGGAEFPIAIGVGDLAIAPYMEFGYGYLLPMQLADLGSLRFSGFSGRAGVGLHF